MATTWTNRSHGSQVIEARSCRPAATSLSMPQALDKGRRPLRINTSTVLATLLGYRRAGENSVT